MLAKSHTIVPNFNHMKALHNNVLYKINNSSLQTALITDLIFGNKSTLNNFTSTKRLLYCIAYILKHVSIRTVHRARVQQMDIHPHRPPQISNFGYVILLVHRFLPSAIMYQLIKITFIYMIFLFSD